MGKLTSLLESGNRARDERAFGTDSQSPLPSQHSCLHCPLQDKASILLLKGRFVRVVPHTNGLWLFADEVFVNPKRNEAQQEIEMESGYHNRVTP
jgi:hypothetical protein